MRLSKVLLTKTASLLASSAAVALAIACRVPIGSPGTAAQGQPAQPDDSLVCTSPATDSGSDSNSSGTSGSSSSGGGFFDGLRPAFGATIQAAAPPPPISGGTLLVTRRGSVVASDPDRDVIDVVDATMTLRFAIALQPGDEPGRLAEDGAGQVHVALRGGGALVTVNPTTGVIVARRAVCPAPRGLAWEASSDLVWVACATGELVAFPSAGGDAAHSFVIERDLRDVVVQSGQLAVTKFRSAEVLRVSASGTILRRDTVSAPDATLPHVAWRTIAGPLAGTTVTVHQVESTQSVATHLPSGYAGGSFPEPMPPSAGLDLEAGGPVDSDGGSATAPIPRPLPQFASGPIVQSALTVLDGAGNALGLAAIVQGPLPVDVALSPDGTFVAVALAGNAFGPLPSVQIVALDAGGGTALQQSVSAGYLWGLLRGKQVVAVAFDAAGDFFAQMREPAQLLVASATNAVQLLTLSTKSRDDTGHDIFHAQAGALMACASCHPEGGDDGHTWVLEGRLRRTPSLRGTIAGTAPYHWPGDEKDMNAILDDVYTGRMGGARLDTSQRAVVTRWVESIPAPPAPSWVDRAAAARGKALFDSPAAGCQSCKACHSGPKFTNNATVDVGTDPVLYSGNVGEWRPSPVQVPPLIGVGWRTPLFHDGCATTILDRFGKCATPTHGSTSRLSKQDVADLTAYLETL